MTWTAAVTDSRMLAVGADLVFAAGGGRIHAIDPASGASRWQAPISEEAQWLTVTSSLVVVSGGQELRGLSAVDGRERWRVAPGGQASARATAEAGLVVVGLANSELVGLDAASGAERWRVPLDQVPRLVLARHDRVYVSLPGISACAFRASTGARQWCTNLRPPVVGEPLITDTSLYAALLDGTLRTFDRESGTQKKMEPLGGRPAMGPQQAGRALAVPLSTSTVVFIAQPGGQVTRLTPATALPQPLKQAAATSDGTLLILLSVPPDGGQILSAYTLKPAVTK